MVSSLPLAQEVGRVRGEESRGEDCREPRGDARDDSDPPGSIWEGRGERGRGGEGEMRGSGRERGHYGTTYTLPS